MPDDGVPEQIFDGPITDVHEVVQIGFREWLKGFDEGYVRGASDAIEALRQALARARVPDTVAHRILARIRDAIPLRRA